MGQSQLVREKQSNVIIEEIFSLLTLPSTDDILQKASLASLTLCPEFGKFLLQFVDFQDFILKNVLLVFGTEITRGILWREKKN